MDSVMAWAQHKADSMWTAAMKAGKPKPKPVTVPTTTTTITDDPNQGKKGAGDTIKNEGKKGATNDSVPKNSGKKSNPK